MRYSILQRFAATAVWTAVALLAAPRCSAQARGTIEFSPVVGVYLPSGRLPAVPPNPICLMKGVPVPYLEDYDAACKPTPPSRTSAVRVGGRLSVWMSQRMAVDGSLWYSPSSVTGPNGGPAAVVVGDVRLLVKTRGSGSWAYLVAGPAFVGQLGDTSGTDAGMGHFGGVVGVGAHLRVASALALRAEVEDYVYSIESYQHHDFALSVSLSLASRIGPAWDRIARSRVHQ